MRTRLHAVPDHLAGFRQSMLRSQLPSKRARWRYPGVRFSQAVPNRQAVGLPVIATERIGLAASFRPAVYAGVSNHDDRHIPIEYCLPEAVEVYKVRTEAISKAAKHGIRMAEVRAGRVLPLELNICF